MKYILILSIIFYSCSITKNRNDFTSPRDDIREEFNKEHGLTLDPAFDLMEFDIDIISVVINSTKDSLSFQGKVYDLVSKEPLIGANVELLPCSTNTNTDIYGLYNLKFKLSECDSFKINYIGYYTNAYAIKDYIKLQ
jgi:hypothetical protein